MGLAASQARFLNLTARKTNLEFEGQQINQQRTMLANQSANYYSQMLTLTVPVPPSDSNYVNVVYSYGDRTINQITGSDSKASIIYTVSKIDNYYMNRNEQQRDIANNNGVYSCGENQLVCLKDMAAFDTDTKENITKGLNLTDAKDVYVLDTGSNDRHVYEYFKKESLTKISNGGFGNIAGYTQNSITKYEQGSMSDVKITRDANNRIVAITYKNNEDIEVREAVSSVTVKDDVAYEEAYNEYTYQTYLYQQQMEEINAQTSVIQAQDKKLELRLKQLDTEQNAVSTEMDNITNLIKKDIENSFKIFA